MCKLKQGVYLSAYGCLWKFDCDWKKTCNSQFLETCTYRGHIKGYAHIGAPAQHSFTHAHTHTRTHTHTHTHTRTRTRTHTHTHSYTTHQHCDYLCEVVYLLLHPVYLSVGPLSVLSLILKVLLIRLGLQINTLIT